MGTRIVVYRSNGSDKVGRVILLTVNAVSLVSLVAFLRHCWWTLTLLMSDTPLTAGNVMLAVLGIVMPPLGALHGVWLWVH